MINKVISVLFCVAVAVATPNVISAKESSSINRSEGKEYYVSAGDLLVSVKLRESLPNAFGGADIFGRKRDRGLVEIRFMGLTEDGRAVFRRRNTAIYSNETTMSRSGMRTGNATVTQSGNTAYVTTMSTGAQAATVQTLPPDTFEVALELTKNPVLTIEDRVVRIISADPNGVRFVVEKQ